MAILGCSVIGSIHTVIHILKLSPEKSGTTHQSLPLINATMQIWENIPAKLGIRLKTKHIGQILLHDFLFMVRLSWLFIRQILY